MSSHGDTVFSTGENLIKADILFVHGLRGYAEETWKKGNVCWPRGLLPSDLAHASIMIWGYDSNISNLGSFTSHNSIHGHLHDFLSDISDVKWAVNEVLPPREPSEKLPEILITEIAAYHLYRS